MFCGAARHCTVGYSETKGITVTWGLNSNFFVGLDLSWFSGRSVLEHRYCITALVDEARLSVFGTT